MNELDRMIRQVVRRYKRKVLRAEEDDMAQTAWVAVEECRVSFDPSRGTPFHAYAYRAAARAIVEYLWRTGSPVSEAEKRLPSLAGVERTEIADTIPQEETHPSTRGIWIEHVRREIEECVQGVPDAHLALRVLLNEEDAATVASSERVHIRRVYKATHAARKAIRRSETLANLWEEGA